MSIYSLGLTLNNVRSVIVMIVDILVMWFIFYYALKIIRTNSRTIQIFKGIILIVVIDFIAKFLGLKSLQFVTDMFINYGFLAIIIIFQPEIRSLLERIGQSKIFSRMTTLSVNEKENLVDQIVTAVMLLSKDQTGALISIEQSQPLDDFVATGTKLDSDVTAELLTSLFVTSTPLHDGAVIIQGDKIACASAYFPPTNRELPSRYGARHRAAIGFSEITDAVTIIVSEETGNVSITESGKIFSVNREQLRNYLLRVICEETKEVHNSPKQSADTKKQSILSKFVVKKQEEPVAQRIQVEAVKSKDYQFDSKQEKNLPVEEIHKQADQEAEAAEIKLPHKKDRPVPSYPRQEQRSYPGIEEKKVQSLPKMTSEEVAKAKEEEWNRYRVHKQDTKQTPIVNEEDHRFDTTKLDISKIVGFHDELESQFKMVEKLDASSKNEEGDKQ